MAAGSCRRQRSARSIVLVRRPTFAGLALTLHREALVSELGRQSTLQSILLQTPIKCAPAQAERLGGLARIAVMARQRFFDQERFHFLQAHILEARRYRRGHSLGQDRSP